MTGSISFLISVLNMIIYIENFGGDMHVKTICYCQCYMFVLFIIPFCYLVTILLIGIYNNKIFYRIFFILSNWMKKENVLKKEGMMESLSK